ncbi:MAG: hypothetical protein HY673_04645 [Chloroflexi bacterium]|nr:hypothetical protein [Chloroflexota bacterium]
MDTKLEDSGKEYLWNGAQWVEAKSRTVVSESDASRLSKKLQRKIGSSNVPRTVTGSVFFFFWDKYKEDMENLGRTNQLNQDNKLVKSLKKREHVWAFARRENATYILVMDLVVAFTRDKYTRRLWV